MADKEATVYIIDVGSSMGDCNNGRVESDLDWSMRYVWDKLSTTVAASRKTWQVGVVGLRTDETDNSLHEGGQDGYENISILQPLGPMSMTLLKDLRGKVKPSSAEAGDAVSAIVVATQMLVDGLNMTHKITKRIILVTDAQGAIDPDSLQSIWDRINEFNMELIIVGVDFDDPEYGFKEEDKSRTKASNEELLRKLADGCTNSVFGTMAQAVEELEMPRIKPVRPFKSYDGQLTLGDPEKYKGAALSIHVERYFKTKLARPVAATSVVIKAESGGARGTQSTHTAGGDDNGEGPSSSARDFTGLSTTRTYKISDTSAPGGKRDVEFDSLAKGYSYGRTAVHISESEHNITKLETTKEFTILGFIPSKKYNPILNMGEVCISVATKFTEKDEIALSALVHALYEEDCYAVARIVLKDGKDPQLLLLMPFIDTDFAGLYDVPLPFAEDYRAYQFPPLDKVITISGTTLTKHRLLPTEDLDRAMSDYVDAMDISSYAVDENGDPQEYAAIDETFSPIIHRVNQAIRSRAIHPDKPIEPATGILTKYSVPPADVATQAADAIGELVRVADVKKVPPKAKGKRQRETVKPISGLDIDALLSGSGNGGGGANGSKSKRPKIEEKNAVPQFKQALARADEVPAIEDAARQMGDIVTSLIETSMADSHYERALENIRVMRDELTELEEPAMFNDFVRSLKKKIGSGALGGDRRDFWFKIKSEKLGLLHKGLSDASDVTEEEATEFLMKWK